MAQSFDVVGYTYRADLYCATCGPAQLSDYDGSDHWMDSESVLDKLAEARGIDRYQEDTFDTQDFPKVLFRDMVEDEVCGDCGDSI